MLLTKQLMVATDIHSMKKNMEVNGYQAPRNAVSFCRNQFCSDKLHFSVCQSHRQVWGWRMPGELFLPDCIVPAVKFGKGEIMV